MQRLATISTHRTYLVRRIAELRAKVRRGHFLAIGLYPGRAIANSRLFPESFAFNLHYDYHLSRYNFNIVLLGHFFYFSFVLEYKKLEISREYFISFNNR